jgi:DNA repair photolyase
MVVRDADILAELSKRCGSSVCVSVPTVHEEAWAALEPGTAHPMQRLRAVRELRRAGVNAGVLMAPVVPGFTTQPARLEATIKAIADHGAAFMGANILHLKGGTRDHFLRFISKEFPDRLDGYERMYRGAYAPKDYTSTVRGLINTLRERYDIGRRGTSEGSRVEHESDQADLPAAPEQGTFVWST